MKNNLLADLIDDTKSSNFSEPQKNESVGNIFPTSNSLFCHGNPLIHVGAGIFMATNCFKNNRFTDAKDISGIYSADADEIKEFKTNTISSPRSLKQITYNSSIINAYKESSIKSEDVDKFLKLIKQDEVFKRLLEVKPNK